MPIREYYHLAQQIHERGGPAKDPALFAQAVYLEDDILAQYGLPRSRRFVRILQSIHRHKKLNEQVLEKTVRRLELAASEYLLTSPVPDVQLLTQAKNKRLSALDVLPEMGLPTQDYAVFVFNHFCNHRHITAQQVIEEYNLLKQHSPMAISRLKEAGGHRNDPVYIQLKSYGFQFLDAYLTFDREIQKDNLTHKEMERQLDQLMDTAASSYLQYLQLRSKGMKDAQAREHTGLTEEVFYRIALFTFMLQKVERGGS